MPKKIKETATTYEHRTSTGVTAPLFTRYRISAKAFHDLHEAGDLTEDDRVELLDGEMIMMSPIGSKHFACVNRITRFFFESIGQRAIVSVQGPVQLDEYNEPQPDIALLHPRMDDYAGGLPRSTDTFLIVEVSDSTLDYDRVKLKAYARASIPEAWIINLVDNWVEVYREPDANGYRLMRRYSPGEMFGPAAFADLTIDPIEVIP